MHKNPQNHSFYIYFNSDSGDFHIQNQSFLFQVEFTTWQAVHFIYTHKMPSCLSGKSPKPSESIRNLLEPLYPMGYFNPIAIHCYPAFYLVLNHTTFSQIKKGHSINYSDGFYIGLLYAVPLVIS